MYPPEQLFKEMSFIAYYLHWSLDTVMNLEHRERHQWCRQISDINRDLSGQPENVFAQYN